MPSPTQVDPRGLRFVAAITSVVLAVVLVLPQGAGEILLALQVGVFAVSSALGVQASPYAQLFARVVRPRIGAPAETEDSRPPRFAQVVGLAFTTAGLALLLLGATTAGYVLVGFAFAAALLNAAVGLCLGCELYLIATRSLTTRTTNTTEVTP